MEWSESRFWGLDDHPGAKQLLTEAIDDIEDADWKDRLVITGASYDLLMGKAVRRPGRGRAHPRDRHALGASPPSPWWPRPPCSCSVGATRPWPPSRRPSLPFDEPDAPTDAVYLGMLVVALGLVAVDLGRFADARIFAEGGHQETVASGIVLAQAWFALILGRTSMAEGDLVDAERWFRESAACFGQTGNRPNEQLCLFSAAWALALQG